MKIIIISIFIFSSFSICYQNDSDSIIIIYPKWEANEIKYVTCYYSVANDFGKFKIDTDSEIKIKNVLDDGYIVLLTILDCKFDSTESSDFDPTSQEDLNQMIGLIYELKFNKKGNFLGLENENEIRNSQNPTAAIKNLKMILPFFEVYNVEFDVYNIQKEYIPIKGINDSVYFSKKTEIIDDTINKIILKNQSYLDDSQSEKLLNIINDSESNYESKSFAEIILNTSFEIKYTISKQGNWLINKKSVVSAAETKITTEYFVK